MACRRFTRMIFCSLMVLCLAALQGQVARAAKGFIEINAYPYLGEVDSDTLLTINTGGNLSDRLSYFGFMNFARKIDAGGIDSGVNFFSEQSLRWRIAEDLPFQLALQANFRSGAENDRYRIGLRWLVDETAFFEVLFQKLNLTYAVTLFPVQFDHEEAYVWMMEHAYRMTFPWLSDRLYLSGFVDHTFNEDLPEGYPSDPIVTETQLGFRLVDNFYLTAEYRLNEYRRSQTNNLVTGLEYKIRW